MRYTLLILSILVSFVGYSQTYDDKIAEAMNSEDWFALDSIYSSAPKDSIDPFLEVFSRCMLGDRFNRLDVSIPAFQKLLESQSENLSLENLKSAVYLYGVDLNRVGKNKEAAEMTEAILQVPRQDLDAATISSLSNHAHRYAALAKYTPYQITFADGQWGKIPFSIDSVGAKDKNDVLMRLNNSYINDIPARITFDTGAAANFLSPDMARKYNLTPLEETGIKVEGMEKRDGYIAVAKELRLGDVTVYDVPFIVIDLKTGNEKADQYIDCFNLVVGIELMLQLKDVTLDFVTNQIVIPSKTPSRSADIEIKPNLCFSSGMGLRCRGLIRGVSMSMNIDSGDSSYGSLGYQFFKRNKNFVKKTGTKDIVRKAGVASVDIMKSYIVPDMTLTLSGNSVCIPGMIVKTKPSKGAFALEQCNIGLKTLMLFGKVRFNLVDFVLTTEPK